MLACLKTTASSLASLATFATANDTSHADTTIALQKIMETLSTIVSTLDAQHIQADTTTTGLLALCAKVNKVLTTANVEANTPGKTLICGIMALTKPDSDKTALIIELDMPESAQHIQDYTSNIAFNFPVDCLGDTAAIKEHLCQLIVRFIPCDSIFVLDNDKHIHWVEEDNFLPLNSITMASWLKNLSTTQIHRLKVSCRNVDITNHMIQECIFIAGHLVAIQKDICAPLQCNKCQQYGYIRVNCKGMECYAKCASLNQSNKEPPSS
ncbi:hypothetical protein C0991_009365 [Blastosporella zonata]|nr:hypothetical protein C0991_009365 [Blastosporella zonata]